MASCMEESIFLRAEILIKKSVGLSPRSLFIYSQVFFEIFLRAEVWSKSEWGSFIGLL